MKLIVCFVPLLVLLLVQDSTQAPSPKAQFGITADLGLNKFLQPVQSTQKPEPKPSAAAPIIKNCTSITGSLSGHSGNQNAAQKNNSIEVKEHAQNC